MDRYNIQCTREQAKRALALGAGIRCNGSINYSKYFPDKFVYIDGINWIIPTVEQMCGWLRLEKNIEVFADRWTYTRYQATSYAHVDITDRYSCKPLIIDPDSMFDTYEEAIYAGIDAALTYLEQQQKGE